MLILYENEIRQVMALGSPKIQVGAKQGRTSDKTNFAAKQLRLQSDLAEQMDAAQISHA